MAYEARATDRIRAAVGRSEAFGAAWRVFWVSRVGIAAVAVFAATFVGEGGLPERNAEKFDVPALTHPFGSAGDTLFSPLARWDSIWYLSIADSGYEGARAAFFPLYPLLVRALATPFGASPGVLLLAAYAISLAALLAALHLLWRLTALELGRPLATPTLLLLAAFPGALFFGAPYSESLFLLVSVGAFYAARTGRWAWAGALAACAAATRSAGILLLVPLALLWWSQRARRPHQLAWLALGPLGLAAYALHLELATGDGLAFLRVQEAWFRHFAGPLGGVWDGTVAAWDSGRELLAGDAPVPRSAALNVMLFGFMLFALAAAVGVVRRLPLAYGAWVVVALMLPLSFPVEPQPLMSLPRFLAVLFPIFMWLALVCEERRITSGAAALSALVLGMFVTQYAGWYFIA